MLEFKNYDRGAMRLIFLLLLFFPHLTGGTCTKGVLRGKPAKNVIILIGDGMGISQYSGGIYQTQRQTTIERFSMTGLHLPAIKGVEKPDQAMSATALSCGINSIPAYIGLDKDSSVVESLFDLAEEGGMSTGIVSDEHLFYPVNAAFYAHTSTTTIENVYLDAYKESGIDLFIGKSGSSLDEKSDLDLNTMEVNGVADAKEMRATLEKLDDRSVLFAEKAFARNRKFLTSCTDAAIPFMERHAEENGFILIINTSSIVKAIEKQDATKLEKAVNTYFSTINACLDFANKNGETLVIATSGYEKGGYAINPGSRKDSLIVEFSTQDNTTTMVPVFANGPGASCFTGVYNYKDIFKKISIILDLQEED